MTTMKPTVLWAQRPDSVYLTIDLKDVKDQKIDVTETKIEFSGEMDGKKYAFEFEFFAAIDKDAVKINTKRCIELFCPKKEEESWSNVCKKKEAYVKVDWNKWLDSDDEGEGFDTAGMQGGPGGMGGMGGMPGMGAMGGMPGMGGMGGGMPGMGGMDFSQMMGGMGGMGGGGGMPDMSEMMANMGGMGGMGGGDSDDEDDLPDLDEPVEGEGKAAAEVEIPSEGAQVGA